MADTTRRDLLRAAGIGAAAMAAPGLVGGARAAAANRPSSAKATQGRPNIILVYTDDQGWTDTSVRMMKDRADSASDFYRTPALEKMAAQGMVFSNAYSPAPVCTPSRAGIQFGKTPARLRQTVVHDVLAAVRGIDCKDEVSIARMIKAADPGYLTAHFGKWGFPPRPPEHAGYDVTDGKTNNADGDWISRKDGKTLPADDPNRIFSLTKRANDFMAGCVKAGRPFFMQVSHYAVHVQHYALKETVEKYRKLPRGKKCTPRDYADPPPRRNAWTLLYAAMIEDLDTGLGMLLEKIDKLGIRDSTYVIFTSDNGGGFRSNDPLRGGKAKLWEGGIRVPTVVCGPGVKRGAQCDVPIAGWDIFPTVSDLIGNTKPLPKGIDGGSLRPLFENGNDGKIKRGTEGLVFHFPWYGNVPMSAIRLGDFKLIENLNTGETRLFNLVRDIGETTDISKSMPAKADELHKKLTGYLKEVDAEDIGDMRAARKKELLEYSARDKKEIGQLQDSIAKAAPGEKKERLKEKLADTQRRLKNHAGALKRLERAGQMKSW